MRDLGMGKELSLVGAGIGVKEVMKWKPKWKIEKYHGEAVPENLFETEEFDGNLLLNGGITVLLNLLGGIAATAYSNANAYIGVGDSVTAAAATQVNLQAAVNKAYKTMDATYPQVSNQTITFKATFTGADANYAWQEFVVSNGSSGTVALNRKVESHGTKASGDTWVVTLAITIS